MLLLSCAGARLVPDDRPPPALVAYLVASSTHGCRAARAAKRRECGQTARMCLASLSPTLTQNDKAIFSKL